MPVASACTVCEHPDRAVVEAALRAGTPSLRTTADRHKLSKTAILRHRDKHMTGPRTSAVEAVRTRKAALAPVQLERATHELVKVRAERLVENAIEAQGAAQRLAELAERGVANGSIELADAARVVKVWVDANGGGVSKALQVLGLATGEIKTGSQTLVLVQDGRVVHPELAAVMDRVLEVLLPWPEAGSAVVRALEEMGAKGAKG